MFMAETRSCSAFVRKRIRLRLARKLQQNHMLIGGAVRPSLPQERREAVPRVGVETMQTMRRQRRAATLFRRGKLHPGGQQKATI